MQYLVLYFDDDRTVILHTKKWIREAGGKISFTEFKERFRDRFHFFSAEIQTETEVKEMRNPKLLIYRLENGMVSNLPLIH